MTNILTPEARVGALAPRERPVRPGLVLAIVLVGQFMAVLDSSHPCANTPGSAPPR